MRRWSVVLLVLAAAAPARAVLGLGGAALVTVIGDPAEAANWAAELDRLSAQLAAANASLDALLQIRAYAGDPRAAAGALPTLAPLLAGSGALAAAGQTQSDLASAWASMSQADQAAAALALASAGGHPGAADPTLLYALAEDALVAGALRGQVADEQTQRRVLVSALADAWGRMRAASTESEKQAVLAEIAQLHAQDQVLASRRRAALDDLALGDRTAADAASAGGLARDQELATTGAALASAAGGRSQQAQAQRAAVLSRAAPAAPSPDYSGVTLWTSADAGTSP